MDWQIKETGCLVDNKYFLFDLHFQRSSLVYNLGWPSNFGRLAYQDYYQKEGLYWNVCICIGSWGMGRLLDICTFWMPWLLAVVVLTGCWILTGCCRSFSTASLEILIEAFSCDISWNSLSIVMRLAVSLWLLINHLLVVFIFSPIVSNLFLYSSNSFQGLQSLSVVFHS